jgi:hypothetical protein
MVTLTNRGIIDQSSSIGLRLLLVSGLLTKGLEHAKAESEENKPPISWLKEVWHKLTTFSQLVLRHERYVLVFNGVV